MTLRKWFFCVLKKKSLFLKKSKNVKNGKKCLQIDFQILPSALFAPQKMGHFWAKKWGSFLEGHFHVPRILEKKGLDSEQIRGNPENYPVKSWSKSWSKSGQKMGSFFLTRGVKFSGKIALFFVFLTPFLAHFWPFFGP